MTGSTSGVGTGTCSLAANNISLGPSRITVSATGTQGNIKLINKYGRVVDEAGLASSSESVEQMEAVFDLSSYSDKDLDGLYVLVNMSSVVKNYNSVGNFIGAAYGPYGINYIKIDY